MAKKFIDLKKDSDAILVGAGAMFLLCVLPGVSSPILSLMEKVRDKIGGEK